MEGETPPLVPADCDLRDFDFMPLDVRRLLRSEWWITATVEEPAAALAAFHLWAEAWHQVPAASLPTNDVVLMHLARVDAGTWSRIKERVMQPWKLASDGRFYHPVLAEKAIDAFERKQAAAAKRLKDKEKIKAWRERRGNESHRDDVTGYVPVSSQRVTGLTGTGTETVTSISTSTPPKGGERARPKKGSTYSAAFESWWTAYPRKVGKLAAQSAWERACEKVGGDDPAGTLQAACEAFAARMKGKEERFVPHPTTWLNQGRWADAPSLDLEAGRGGGYVPMGVGG